MEDITSKENWETPTTFTAFAKRNSKQSSGKTQISSGIVAKGGAGVIVNVKKFLVSGKEVEHDRSLSNLVLAGQIQVTPIKEKLRPYTESEVNDENYFADSSAVTGTGMSVVESGMKPSSVKRIQFEQQEVERVRQLELENVRLREALKQLKRLITNQVQLVTNNAVIVEGAKKYVSEKALSAQKLTPKKRYGSAIEVKILGWEIQEDEKFAEYKIEVKFGDDIGHVACRRFSEFLALRQRLLNVAEAASRSESSCSFFYSQNPDEINLRTLTQLRAASFPQKRWFSNLNENVLNERVEVLQEFLKHVLRTLKRAGRGSLVRSVMSDWLGIHRRDEDAVWCDDRIKPLVEYDSRTKATRLSEAFDKVLTTPNSSKRNIMNVDPSPINKPSASKADEDLELL